MSKMHFAASGIGTQHEVSAGDWAVTRIVPAIQHAALDAKFGRSCDICQLWEEVASPSASPVHNAAWLLSLTPSSSQLLVRHTAKGQPHDLPLASTQLQSVHLDGKPA